MDGCCIRTGPGNKGGQVGGPPNAPGMGVTAPRGAGNHTFLPSPEGEGRAGAGSKETPAKAWGDNSCPTGTAGLDVGIC